MVGHHRRLREPALRNKRERRVVAAVIAIAAAAIVALVIYAALPGGRTTSGAHCINVTVPSTTGAATIHACGSAARETCAAARKTGGAGAAPLLVPCRRAGF
jgi:hypothetical protein